MGGFGGGGKAALWEAESVAVKAVSRSISDRNQHRACTNGLHHQCFLAGSGISRHHNRFPRVQRQHAGNSGLFEQSVSAVLLGNSTAGWRAGRIIALPCVSPHFRRAALAERTCPGDGNTSRRRLQSSGGVGGTGEKQP